MIHQRQQSRYPEALEALVELLRGVQGVGRRSAERMALAILKWDDAKIQALSETIRDLKSRVTLCPDCGNLSSDGGLCQICASPLRDRSSLCVVEESTQIRAIEAGAAFKGLYHVMGGRLAPLEGKTAESLNIEKLDARVGAGGICELILAFSPDVEGQATAVYIAGRYKGRGLRVSCLARGLPAGSDLSYADPATIAAAISGRRPFE
jgi:recombination protein RecR